VRRSRDNILCHELLGLRVRILAHLDPSLEGREGVVVWETARTLEVDVGGKVITVLKPGSRLSFEIDGVGWVEVRGDSIIGRPAERAKRMLRGEACSAGV